MLSLANDSSISEHEWDKLVNLVRDNCLIPVLGPELLVSQQLEDGIPYYQYWGRELARQAGMRDSREEDGLYQVANLLSARMNPNDLAYDIDDLVRRRRLPTPAALSQLASIRDISLYVTTTIDHLMRQALDETPGRAGAMESISFAPHGASGRIDLSTDFTFSRATGLFHLFGASSSVDGSFAKTEDDLIEFSWSLLDKSYAPVNFYDYLQRKTVLLLGCSFPDWLGRFFIHALNAGRHEERMNIYYVSDICDCGLREYLSRRHAKAITGISPVSFVAELHRRWSEASSAPAPGVQRLEESENQKFKPGAVFLSYAREDRETVRQIREQLEQAGIDTWMDERALEPGEEFQQSIRDNIRSASFFIAVISQSLSNSSGRGRFLWKEWKWAEDAWLERRREDRFLQPLVIDETPPGAPFIEPPYRDLHWARLEDGKLPQSMVETLITGIRRYRRGL